VSQKMRQKNPMTQAQRDPQGSCNHEWLAEWQGHALLVGESLHLF